MSDKVCAVVVSYNRKDLLIECLDALRKQTRPLQGIYIVDNASTDNTPDLLFEKRYIRKLPPQDIAETVEEEFQIESFVYSAPIKIYYTRMPENTGSAGGFYEGTKRAYEKGFDWIWCMDDDTIPQEDALNNLIKKANELKDINVGFLSSKVLWTDGTPHIMNIPAIKPLIDGIPFNLYEDKGVLLIKSASFVSLLVSKDVVRKAGFPIKEFFIWGDDVEYTLRITEKGFLGLYVGESIVFHKTKTNYSSKEIGVSDRRFYYRIRNRLWIYKIHYKKDYFHLLRHVLLTPKLPLKVWYINIKASIDSFIRTPKVEYGKEVRDSI